MFGAIVIFIHPTTFAKNDIPKPVGANRTNDLDIVTVNMESYF